MLAGVSSVDMARASSSSSMSSGGSIVDIDCRGDRDAPIYESGEYRSIQAEDYDVRSFSWMYLYVGSTLKPKQAFMCT